MDILFGRQLKRSIPGTSKREAVIIFSTQSKLPVENNVSRLTLTFLA